MNIDDIFAYLAAKPKKNRPHELKSDSRFLAVWLRLRADKSFFDDVILRHGLDKCTVFNETDPIHEHAISNAWGHAMQVWVTELSR